MVQSIGMESTNAKFRLEGPTVSWNVILVQGLVEPFIKFVVWICK